ncbi:MAG TPA: hypothetical protein VLS90_05135, partial [Thermodesulfobacteriota bacterium]|nr:hypothetical protein [Thermodesulfobacteriota bacterium]
MVDLVDSIPIHVIFGAVNALKFAVTILFPVMFTVQDVAVPAQAPPHPAKSEQPGSTFRVTVPLKLLAVCDEQFSSQGTAPITFPFPVPPLFTVSVYVPVGGGGGGGAPPGVNVAVTFWSVFMVTRQEFPLHPGTDHVTA